MNILIPKKTCKSELIPSNFIPSSQYLKDGFDNINLDFVNEPKIKESCVHHIFKQSQ